MNVDEVPSDAVKAGGDRNGDADGLAFPGKGDVIELTLGLLGRGPVGVVFMSLGLAAIVLGILFRQTSWFLAAIAIPGATAALAGTTVWATKDVSLRWLLVFGPLATWAIFVSRREGIAHTSAAVVTTAAVAAAFFLLGGLVAFFYSYRG